MTLLENEPDPRPEEKRVPPPRRRLVLTALVLLTAGALLILRQMNYAIPDWIFSWQVLLICIGIFIGEKHNFNNPSFAILILIGGIFLINDFFPDLTIRHYLWPALLIIGGVALLVKPARVGRWGGKNFRGRRFNHERYFEEKNASAFNSGEDYLDIVTIFGGVKKNILSKTFKGGEATSFFGGTEINLMQADIQGHVVLDLTQIFGGTKLILPPHWEIKSEIVNIFGGVEDKRPVQNITVDGTKVIVLKGTSIFGGIEIRSY
ncbi:MAG: hypothetical protein H7Y00_05000 [Fimbriimonadaceae bacterium]|nr:hypothetical protein [Chitinophagales bacterium]